MKELKPWQKYLLWVVIGLLVLRTLMSLVYLVFPNMTVKTHNPRSFFSRLKYIALKPC